MDTFDQMTRIKRLDYMIRTKSTGTPAELAAKLGISISQLYLIIKQLKIRYEAPIYYSKVLQSYCYNENVRFTFGFKAFGDPLDKKNR